MTDSWHPLGTPYAILYAMREKKQSNLNETVRHSDTPCQRYCKSTQRTQAMSSEYFSDCQTFDNLIHDLQNRTGKTRAQWKTDKRLAHSILKRARVSKMRRLGTLGTTAGIDLAKNAKLNNKTFTVCQLKTNSLDYVPRYKNIGGTPENEFNERYKKERYILDKQQTTRTKN